MINLDSIFNLYQSALNIREEKLSLISSNIVNQDTPGYKAKDIDFKSELRNALSSNQQDLSPNGSSANLAHSYHIKYRRPLAESADGNTVDSSMEKVAFMDNVVRYNSTLAFIHSKKAELMEVLKEV